MDERGGLEGVAQPLAGQAARGDRAEVVVYPREEILRLCALNHARIIA